MVILMLVIDGGSVYKITSRTGTIPMDFDTQLVCTKLPVVAPLNFWEALTWRWK